MTQGLSRRQALVGTGALMMVQQPLAADATEADWLPATPSVDEGFTADLGALLDQAIAEKRVWNIHGLIITRNGRVVLERYFEGEDRARGVGSLGRVAFTPDTLHDLRSCSKSLVGLLYGIALQQGMVPSPEATLFSEFPEHADLAQLGREQPRLLGPA